MDIEQRFEFGKNWKRYLTRVGNEERTAARRSLQDKLSGIDPTDATFLDIGSGSGLFSCAAFDTGFSKVMSFDYDLDSVEATLSLKAVAANNDERWTVLQGSVLDAAFMKSLGSFDVVYSWGVLHHTGSMWEALANAAESVKPRGLLFIALYNDQGWISKYWLAVKRLYVGSPAFVRSTMVMLFGAYFGTALLLADLARLRNPLARYRGDGRGMKFKTDLVDWIGGYPFEVAKPGEVRAYLKERGFSLVRSAEVGRRHGCNEFVFRRD